MTDHKNLSESEYWSNRYIQKRNGWDNGFAHPFLPNILAYLGGDLRGERLLVIGAGPGHDADWFSNVATEIVAIDFSKEAKKSFELYYPNSPIRYELLDFFEMDEKTLGQFDVVLEHTLLCAIDPKRYVDYFKTLSKIVKPEGFFAGIIWNKSPVEEGPPFSVSQVYVQTRLKESGFQIHVESPVEPTIRGREGTENFVLAKKKV